MPEKIAVIIVNYKTPQKTEKCVRSVLSSKYRNFKIYIIDNGSGDENADYLTRLFKKEKKVVVISLQDNQGYGGGVNLGLKKIKEKTDYLLISNSDVTFSSQTIYRLIRTAKETGKVNIYLPGINLRNFGDKLVTVGSFALYPSPSQFRLLDKERNLQKNLRIPYLGGSCFLISREIFEKVGGFTEDYFLYGEDIDLGYKVRRVGGEIIFVPEAEICHEFHGSSSRFSPLSRYYIARNTPRVILKFSEHKYWHILCFYFWGILGLLALLAGFKWKSVLYYFKGTIDFWRGVKGHSQNII